MAEQPARRKEVDPFPKRDEADVHKPMRTIDFSWAPKQEDIEDALTKSYGSSNDSRADTRK